MEHNNYTEKSKQLMMYAMALVDHVDELWQVYSRLAQDVAENNPDKGEVIQSVISELSENLGDIQDQLAGQMYLASGVYEPLPVDKVDDFEGSVLTTLAGLDTVDLDKYRVERFEHE